MSKHYASLIFSWWLAAIKSNNMKYLTNFILSLLIPLHVQVVALPICDDTENPLLHICTNDSNYDKGVPFSGNGQPLLLKTSATIYSVDEIDENDETISVHFLLSVFWNDSRLQLQDPLKSEYARYELEEADIKSIFYPTLRIGNHRQVRKSLNVGPTNADYFWFGGVNNSDSGPHYLEYQQSLKVAIYCSFDFSQFPFDSNVCNLTLGSTDVFKTMLVMNSPRIRYGYQLHEYGGKQLKMNQSRLPFDIHLQSMAPYVHTEAGFEYSYAGISISVSRNRRGTLIIGFFVPTLLFSILSLMSYMIHPDVVPGRLGLLVTLCLIVANIYNSVNAPKRRGFSYIDIWMVGIQGPILFALAEYAFLLGLKRFHTIPIHKKRRKAVGIDPNSDRNSTSRQLQPMETWDIEVIGRQLDLTACIISLVFIIFFNIGYWLSAYILK